jgi:hypothetical protein
VEAAPGLSITLVHEFGDQLVFAPDWNFFLKIGYL